MDVAYMRAGGATKTVHNFVAHDRATKTVDNFVANEDATFYLVELVSGLAA